MNFRYIYCITKIIKSDHLIICFFTDFTSGYIGWSAIYSMLKWKTMKVFFALKMRCLCIKFLLGHLTEDTGMLTYFSVYLRQIKTDCCWYKGKKRTRKPVLGTESANVDIWGVEQFFSMHADCNFVVVIVRCTLPVPWDVCI